MDLKLICVCVLHFSAGANTVTIKLGFPINGGPNIHREVVAAENRIIHEDFNANTLENDIALIRLTVDYNLEGNTK
jgi:hypothetical protein